MSGAGRVMRAARQISLPVPHPTPRRPQGRGLVQERQGRGTQVAGGQPGCSDVSGHQGCALMPSLTPLPLPPLPAPHTCCHVGHRGDGRRVLHKEAGSSRAALRAAIGAAAVAVAAAGDGHHGAVDIICQAQQQGGPWADRSAALLLLPRCYTSPANAAASAALCHVRVWRGRLVSAKRRRLQVARQQLVRLAGQSVHQAQDGLLSLLRLGCRAQCACCACLARRQGKGEERAGGL